MSSGELAAALLHAIGRFSKLQRVEFGYHWTEIVGLEKCSTGSPLMRSWNPWHCRPQLGYTPNEQMALESPTDVAWHYEILVNALVKATNGARHKLNLCSMKLRISPMWIFDLRTSLGSEVAQLGTVVGNLERFVLKVPSRVDLLVSKTAAGGLP